MRTSTATAAAVSAALLAVFGGAAPSGHADTPQPAQQRPLRILLTNDNGYDHPFITALQKALTAAGDQVTIVAPQDNVYGAGTSYSGSYGGVLRTHHLSPDVWSVEGTPTDAVTFGIENVFGSQPPDLVLAGVNAGQNDGRLVDHSGLLGAAVAALDDGVPAIAVNDEVDLSNWSFPSLDKSIAFTLRLVQRLAATSGGGPLLPDHVALNVNYPLRPNGKVAFTQVGSSAYVWARYQAAPNVCDGCYQAVTTYPAPAETLPDTDVDALRQGEVSITPIDGDWTAGLATHRAGAQQVRRRLSGLSG